MGILIAEAPTSTYRERPPAPASHVLCVWCQATGAGATLPRHRVLPDRCVDLVWIGAASILELSPTARSASCAQRHRLRWRARVP